MVVWAVHVAIILNEGGTLMPSNKANPKGPPKDTLAHLIDVHEANGTLGNILNSAIGDAVEGELIEQNIAALNAFTELFGFEPWTYDGTTLQMLDDVNPGPGSSQPRDFIAVDGLLTFTAYDGSQTTIFVYDADAGSAVAIDGITNIQRPQVEFDGALYVTAYSDTGSLLPELLRADVNTYEVTSIDIGNYTFPTDYIEFDNALYFRAQDSSQPTTSIELFRLDAGSDTASLVEVSPGTNTIFQSSYVFDEKLYFSGSVDGTTDYDLHILEAGGTTTTDIELNGYLSNSPSGFFEFDESLFFNLKTSDSETTFFRLDAGSTSPIDLGAYAVTNSAVFNGSLYFGAEDTSLPGIDTQLYRLDAGSNVPVQVLDTNISGNDRVGALAVFGDALYFSADSSDGDRELFKLNPDGVSATEFDFFDDGSSFASVLGVVNDTLLVGALVDEDDDGTSDRFAMLEATGDPQSPNDFQIVDDGSGTFSPGQVTIFGEDEFLF